MASIEREGLTFATGLTAPAEPDHQALDELTQASAIVGGRGIVARFTRQYESHWLRLQLEPPFV